MKKLRIKKCESLFSKISGLMFAKRLKQDEALLFEFNREGRHCVHSLFVFFPFKVVFLDRNKRVIEAKTAKPFASFLVPRKKCKYILEVNEGFKVKTGAARIFSKARLLP